MENNDILRRFRKYNGMGQYAEIKLDSAISKLMDNARMDTLDIIAGKISQIDMSIEDDEMDESDAWEEFSGFFDTLRTKQLGIKNE